MRIAVLSGWREFGDIHHVDQQVTWLHERGYNFFRVGCARGFDQLARKILREAYGPPGDHWITYGADWGRYKGGGGHMRNQAMLMGDKPKDPTHGKYADLLLAVPQPWVHAEKDSGTFDCIKEAVRLGIGLYVPPHPHSATERLAASR